MERVIEVQPHIWTLNEALKSGHTAFRLKIELSSNPFQSTLGDMWATGWNDAAASDTFSTKKVDYMAMEGRYERSSRSNSGRRPATNAGRPGKTSRDRSGR